MIPSVLVHAFLVGCSAGTAAHPTASWSEVATVVVTLETPAIALGQRTSAHALVVNRFGRVLTERNVRWNVVAGSEFLRVDSNGTLVALATGRALVSARVDSAVATVPVDVLPPPTDPLPPDEPVAPPVDTEEEQRAARRPALPRVYLDFPFPAVTGRSIAVPAGGDLQRALDRAQRGDEIVLAAGASYVGNFTLPAKPGSAADGWIVIRGDRSSRLPPLGTRVGMQHGILMPSIATPNRDPALRVLQGASGWRMVGLEVTVSASVREQQYGLIFLGEAGSPQTTLATVPTDLVLDRMYVHGLPTTNMSRCVALNSARTAITDSYLGDCHGKGFDSQAIWGGNGPGPYKIVNNTLEGAGENIMFGGSDPAIPGLVPSDIEIRRNHIVTPLAWKGLWTKKNLFELKNAARVLLEANVLEGSWTDGQTGWAIVLKSANQAGRCTWCRTTDVTIRLNLVRNAGGGVNVAGIGDNSNVDTIAQRILVTETVFDGIGAGAYNGDLRGFQLLSGSMDVTVERTVVSGPLDAALMLDNRRPAVRASFRDNVWVYGRYGAVASGAGAGSPSLRAGAPGAVWERMIFVGPQRPGFPVGTGFVSSERHASTALRVRAAVDSATAGVVRPNGA